MMITYEFGEPEAKAVLIQPVDGHDLGLMENEVNYIKDNVPVPFRLIAVKVEKWNHDLSPWHAPAVFGKEDFGDGASKTLEEIKQLYTGSGKTYVLGGYSLARLFALWAAYQTDIFTGIAAASPSIWFPEFTEYMRENEIRTNAVYLSLGDREHRTKNPVVAAVADKIKYAAGLMEKQNISHTLEWNTGNHFMESDIRTARAFAWVLDNIDIQ